MRAIADLTCLHCGEVNDELLIQTQVVSWAVGRTRRCRRCNGPLYLAEFTSVPSGTSPGELAQLRAARGGQPPDEHELVLA